MLINQLVHVHVTSSPNGINRSPVKSLIVLKSGINLEKVETLFSSLHVYVYGGILDTQGQLILLSVAISCQNLNASKIICISKLKRIRSITTENQRTNGPVNDHLISEQSISTKTWLQMTEGFLSTSLYFDI